jgi:hypothetical protein
MSVPRFSTLPEASLPGFKSSAEAMVETRSVLKSVQLALARQDQKEQYLFLGSRPVFTDLTARGFQLMLTALTWSGTS